MQFAILPPVSSGVTADPVWMKGFATHAERCGFESIVMVEHAVVVSGYTSTYPYAASGRMPLADDLDIPDPLDVLSYLAAVTETIGLATGVLVVPNHHPVVLAKRLATIDALSGGRVRLCAGVGWMQEEIEACGSVFGTRGRRTDETIDAMRALWADSGAEGASFKGEFFSFEHAHSHPKPARAGGVPIHIGGHSPAAARRAGLRGDGLQPLGAQGDELRSLVDLMRATAESAGRDPDALELSLGGGLGSTTEESVAAAEALGACRMVLSPKGSTVLDDVAEELSIFAARFGLSEGPTP